MNPTDNTQGAIILANSTSTKGLRVGRTGFVGIGPTILTPDAALQVTSITHETLRLVSTDDNGLGANWVSFYKNNQLSANSSERKGWLGYGDSNSEQFTISNRYGDVVLGTGSFDKVWVKFDGNVGIGTANPLARLHVKAPSGQFGMVVESIDSYSGLYLKDSLTTDFCGPMVYADTIELRTLNIDRINVNENGTIVFNNYGTSTIDNAGTGISLVVDGNGRVFRDSSSMRYKENVSDFLEDYTKILGVEPKLFNYKSDETKSLVLGYIAEDFHDLGLEKLLVYDDEGKAEAIRHDKTTVYAIEMIKKQQTIIDSLEQRINDLENN